MSTVAISGGFDPIHDGHIDLIKNAAEYGDVIVILNSDAWLLRKKKYHFFNFTQRQKILFAIEHVKMVIDVDDTDGTVCQALRYLKPTYFANGGDRRTENTPELAICLDLGIKPIFGIGGGKIESSSELVKRLKPIVKKPWGEYQVLAEGDGWKTKSLTINPGQKLSLQSHKQREEHWVIAKGAATVTLGTRQTNLLANDTVFVAAGEIHRISNNSAEDLIVIETQLGSYLGEDDIIRYADDYGRAT